MRPDVFPLADSTGPGIKGWCPGAHRPMLSGDGWILRVRPRLARMEAAQWRGLAGLAQRFGNGIIDLTSRANLQVRGVKDAGTEPLFRELAALGLLDPDAETEARRNLICAPDWQAGDATERLGTELLQRLAELPALPAKVGFAVDAGARLRLADASADLRIERGRSGGLILRADGRALGASVGAADAVARMIALAHWFAGTGSGRMALCGEPLPEWAAGTEAPAAPQTPFQPGQTPVGACIGVAFGQIAAADLLALPAVPLRLAHNRLLLLEGAAMAACPGFITRPDDPLLRIDACPGAPMCASASVVTRDLARQMVPPAGQSLHVSGCAKGCARGRAADVTLVGRGGRFDVVRRGAAWDMPEQTGLLPGEVSGDALFL